MQTEMMQRDVALECGTLVPFFDQSVIAHLWHGNDAPGRCPHSKSLSRTCRTTWSIKSAFTLIELLVAMSVFTILMLALTGFFNAAQKVWTESNKKTQVYENARIGMDLITRDLQGIYYENGAVPFFHYYVSASAADSDRIAFVAYSNLTPSGNASKLAEIQYQLGVKYSNDLGCNVNWLQVSVVGDQNTTIPATPPGKYDFYKNFDYNFSTGVFAVDPGAAADSGFKNVVPYVSDLKFKCYKQNQTTGALESLNTMDDAAQLSEFPYAIRVEMKLLDRNSWKQWKMTGSDTIRTENERDFSKMIILGDKGQYKE